MDSDSPPLFAHESRDWLQGFRTATLLYAKSAVKCGTALLESGDNKGAEALLALSVAIVQTCQKHAPLANPEMN